MEGAGRNCCFTLCTGASLTGGDGEGNGTARGKLQTAGCISYNNTDCAKSKNHTQATYTCAVVQGWGLLLAPVFKWEKPGPVGKSIAMDKGYSATIGAHGPPRGYTTTLIGPLLKSALQGYGQLPYTAPLRPPLYFPTVQSNN